MTKSLHSTYEWRRDDVLVTVWAYCYIRTVLKVFSLRCTPLTALFNLNTRCLKWENGAATQQEELSKRRHTRSTSFTHKQFQLLAHTPAAFDVFLTFPITVRRWVWWNVHMPTRDVKSWPLSITDPIENHSISITAYYLFRNIGFAPHLHRQKCLWLKMLFWFGYLCEEHPSI